MGLSSCNEPNRATYLTSGNVITVNFRDETGEFQRSIKIHEENTLKKSIQMYQEKIGKKNLHIKKAIYEPDSRELSLSTKLKDLNINFGDIIIVYLK